MSPSANGGQCKGSCSCGAVRFTGVFKLPVNIPWRILSHTAACAVQGEPRAQFYCHCAECARTHSTHFVEVIAFQDGANAFKVTSGEEMLQSYGTEKALRRFCKTCGSIVSVLNGTNGLIGTYPRLIEGWQFRPEAHFFTGQSQARLDHLSDGLPKFVDSSLEHGGTGKFHPSVAKWNRFEKPQAGTISAQPSAMA